MKEERKKIHDKPVAPLKPEHNSTEKDLNKPLTDKSHHNDRKNIEGRSGY